MTPFEAGLGFFVNMDKSDFIGKDSLKEKDKRPCLFGLTCEKVVPAAGSKVILKNQIVGYVTAGVPSPTLQIGIGYVRFYEPDSWVGQDLLLELPGGDSYEAKVVNLPFIDLEKKIVRGLDRTIPSKKEELLFNEK
jgi:aminomethyltransferase